MKRKMAAILAVIMLMGTVLTGCVDKETGDPPTLTPAEKSQRQADRQRQTGQIDPNRTPPPPNPDGTLG